MTTKPYSFPEEITESTAGGMDFPGSAGDRERGKFRPSSIPRRTVVAVAGDDGRPVARSTNELLSELILWQKAMVIGLCLTNGEFTVDDLLDAASET